MPAAEAAKSGAGARMEELRRAVGAATDAALRARLRVQLADLLRGRDAAQALEELRRAASEAPGLPAVTLGVASFARSLPPRERLELLAELTAAGAPAAPSWSAALADAHVEAGAPARAAVVWLELARDERVPTHRRRVAARRAMSLAEGAAAADVQRAALLVSAGLASGRGRLGFLRRALALAGPGEPADELQALVSQWLDAGGDGRAVDPVLARLRAAGGAPAALERLTAEAARRGPRPSPARAAGSGPVAGAIPAAAVAPARLTPPGGANGSQAAPGANGANGANGAAGARKAAPLATAAARPARVTPDERLDAALAEARAGHANRARRLADGALRGLAFSATLAGRVSTLENALREGGYLKEALQVRRTFAEALEGDERSWALAELADEAEQAGLAMLSRAWRADAGLPARHAQPPDPTPSTPAEHFLVAQQLLARAGDRESGASVEPVLAMLAPAMAGHAGADAALALADELLARVHQGAELDRHRLELLRTAHAAEFDGARRLRLAERLAQALQRLKDPVGAVAVLERAIEGAGPGSGARLRTERARLLREMGRARDLAAALEGDAAALAGADRLRALAERGTLLDAAGEPERALEVRLMALAEFPADLTLLGAARKRLESTGRPAESLRLAVAAVARVADAPRKLELLRDIARLSEKSAVNPADAASAWLAVLELDPTDAAACQAAERLLLAVGDWERCADLLSWAAARAVAAPGEPPGARGALLWRLAELRRERLGQGDEALRLYGELDATTGRPQGPLPDGPDLSGLIARDPPLRLQTARAAVAPTVADRARALLDRAGVLLERARPTEAERDALTALELDPRNIEIIAVLERVHEKGSRWGDMARELRQRAGGLAPPAAARLWFGAGRAGERLGDRVAAREAYRRAMSLDPALPEPIAALGALAARDGNWNEVAALLESEVALTGSPARKGRLLAELAAVQGERLGNPARAVELVDTAMGLLPEEPRILELGSRFNLAVGRWEAAVQVLDRLVATGAAVPDAAERYYQAAVAAEAAGQDDRALTLYSRSYARNTSYRPTLERLSAICFGRDQWDNAWKATEALLDRHGADLEPAVRAALLVRSALADIHIGQRAVAAARLASVITRGGAFVPDVGIRDVAETWGGMRLEPRLLAGMDRTRRDRALARAGEALALAGGAPDVRRRAQEILGALAMVEGRWDDALTALTALADEEGLARAERADFLIAIGDLLASKRNDPAEAQELYRRAAEVSPGDPRLATRRPGGGAAARGAGGIAHDVTDEMLLDDE